MEEPLEYNPATEPGNVLRLLAHTEFCAATSSLLLLPALARLKRSWFQSGLDHK